MTTSGSFLQELDEVIQQGAPERRDRALSYAADALIAGRYSDDQIWLFGEIIEKLARELEVTARVRLASRLAPSANAPERVINRLAQDKSIEVAGPVLRESQKLDARTLVAIARANSQQHLLAISQRKSLTEEVTGVLVERGNQKVVNSVVANPGARLSETSILNLIKRSEDDSILAENLGKRHDIPRPLFQQLISKASNEVRRKLMAEHHWAVEQVSTTVAEATGEMHAKVGPASKKYFDAKRAVLALHQRGSLGECNIFEYAQSHQLEAAILGLSMLCSLPGDVVERAVNDPNGETLLILTKALGFSWETTMALLFLGAENHKIRAARLDSLSNDFVRLDVESARQILALYQQRKAESGSKLSVLPQLQASR